MNPKVKKTTKTTEKENEKRIEEEVRKRIDKEVAKRVEEQQKEGELAVIQLKKHQDALREEPLYLAFEFLENLLSASGVEILQTHIKDGLRYPVYVRCSWDIAKRLDNISYYYTRKVGDNIWQIGLKSEENGLDDLDLFHNGCYDIDEIWLMANRYVEVDY